GTSNALTLNRPLSVQQASNGFHFVNGTPSDCVHIALTGLLDFRPDLIVSGINNGAKIGRASCREHGWVSWREGRVYTAGTVDCVFFQAEDGIRDRNVTGVQTCALPILGLPML